MKKRKSIFGVFLSCVLAISTILLSPVTVNAEEVTLGDVDNSGGFRQNESSRIELTDAEQTYVFTSTSNPNADQNWHAPAFFVYSENNAELFAGRSDAYGWVGADNTAGGLPAGYNYQTFLDPPFTNWDSWRDANKAGVECKLTMRKVGDYAVVALYNSGVTSIVTVPAVGTVSVSLSGENCVLTGIRSAGGHIDLSPAVDLIGNGGNGGGGAQEGTFDLVDNSGGYKQSESPRMGVTDAEQTYVFTSTSNANADRNWHTPVFFVYSENNAELFAGRSDAYGMVGADNTMSGLPEGYRYQTSFDAPYGDWPSWLVANKAGVQCKLTMRKVGDYVIVALYNHGVTSTVTVPAAGAASVTLSGEFCTLNNIVPSEDHIDLSAAVDAINGGSGEPGEGEPGEGEPGEGEPGEGEPGTGDVFLDCSAFWSAHTAGFEITQEPHTYTFRSRTYEGAVNNWETPLFVIFHSGDGLVNGEGYREYGVLRSDNWYWDGADMIAPIGKASESFPEGFDWAAWQAANRNGVDCAVTTQLYNGCALIGVTNNGVTTTYAVRLDPAVKNYLSLTGELCTLSDLQASDQHMDLTAARASADAMLGHVNQTNHNSNPPAAPASEVRPVEGGEILAGSAWWSGMAVGSNQLMSGDGTWTWIVHASALLDGYGAFSVEIYDPATNGYITTGSDRNAWTAEGFDPKKAMVVGVPAELDSKLVEGHAYVVTVTRSGNTFMVHYMDYTANTELCSLAITPSEMASNDVQIHVMAQVGTYITAFSQGALAGVPVPKAGTAGGSEVLTGTEWWNGMEAGSYRNMSGDGTWTWTVQASDLKDGYGAFSVEICDPAINGYITTGSDKNAWTAEGFDPAKAVISGIPAKLDSKLVEGHTYAVTVTRAGNTFTVRYTDHTTGKELCTLVITPGEVVSNDVMIHVMAQVGTFVTAFNQGSLIAALGDSVPFALYAIAVIGLAAIAFGCKKRFVK